MAKKLRPYDVIRRPDASASGGDPSSERGPRHRSAGAGGRPPGFQSWLDAVPFGLLVVRPDGVVEQVNGHAATLLGYTVDELVGSGVERLVPQRMAGHHRALREGWVGHAEAAPMTRLRTVLARCKDGSGVPVHVELSRPWEGQPGHTLVTLRDMRPQLALEAQLHRLQRMENLGLLAAGVVHDFNNHLTALELLADMNRDRGGAWRDVHDTTAQLRHLVDSLRRVSRAEAEVVAPIDVCALVAEHRAVFERMAGGRLEVSLAADTALVHGRAAELLQSLVNLLLNAAHAHREAGVERPIRLSVTHPAGRVELSVIDEGVGMSEAQLAQACVPGFTSRGHRGGSGLGLAIVRSVAETHGGRLVLHSHVGEGTTARMVLPAIAKAAANG